MSNLDEILSRLDGVQNKGSYYMARCPSHEDRTPSLEIKDDNGTILLFCFAGCQTEDILKAIGLQFKDLFPDADLYTRMSAVEREQYKQAIRLRRLEQQQAETARKLDALEKMAQCKDWQAYHDNLSRYDFIGMEYWLSEGMTPATIEKYRLGYCPSCPTDRDHRDSFTIPVFNAGQLRNIRHRLNVPPGHGDKYRPHRAGLPATLFNADMVAESTEWLLIIEGEKKSIILTQAGMPNAAVMGQTTFSKAWVSRLAHIGTVLFGYDPDATEQAERDAALFGERGRVVDWPLKPDDMITHYGATADDLQHYINLARPVV